MNRKHVHLIGIGGIGISGLARYYNSIGFRVSGSDATDSDLLATLRDEGMEISIGHSVENLPKRTELVVYSEAIITKPDLSPEEQVYANPELSKARELKIRHVSYPNALAEVFDKKLGIAVGGSHGKSTTTAMLAVMMASSPLRVTAIVGTQVPELGNRNFYHEESEYMVIEACEYKRAFLHYHPFITIITNIDLDHLDYYKNLDDYLSAFQAIVDQTREYVLISSSCLNSEKLNIPKEKKIIVGDGRIQYSRKTEELHNLKLSVTYEDIDTPLPALNLNVPGKHLEQDAYLAFTVGKLLGLNESFMVQKLNNYKGSWRRSEVVGATQNGNMIISDYGHHPNEIRPTLEAIRTKYGGKHIFVIFQPHQYSRTRELLTGFSSAFGYADTLVIPNIYYSRDKEEDVAFMTTERLVETIAKVHPHVLNGYGLENTRKMIRDFDREHPQRVVFILLGAGDVDSLRNTFI